MGFASIMRPDGTHDILGEPYASDMQVHAFCPSCSQWKRFGAAPLSADGVFICQECIDGKPPL